MTGRRGLAPLLLAAAVLTGCTSAEQAAPAPDAVPVENTTTACPEQPDEPAAGDELPPGLAFDCLGGGELDLGRAQGVPTVVNLWGSWCGPCREELPLVQQLADTAGDQLKVVGLVSKDGQPQAASFAADAGVTVPAAYDGEGRTMDELGIRALPYTYFLDAEGAITFTQIGPVTSLEEFRALVAEHLGVTL